MQIVTEETLFPQDPLFWKLVKEARWFSKHPAFTNTERRFYLLGYKHGWQDNENRHRDDYKNGYDDGFKQAIKLRR